MTSVRRALRRLPPWKRHFLRSEFEGCFLWTRELSHAFRNQSLYHACHEDEWAAVEAAKELHLRSYWHFYHPQKRQPLKRRGVWCGLNPYSENHYGNYRFKFPVDLLEGRRFMVFCRMEDRRRLFFVEREARTLTYWWKGKYPKIDPTVYFDERGSALSLKLRAVYDFVLNRPLSIADASVEAVRHDRCIPDKCSGTRLRTTQDHLISVGKSEIRELAKEVVRRRPDLQGETITITLPFLLEE